MTHVVVAVLCLAPLVRSSKASIVDEIRQRRNSQKQARLSGAAGPAAAEDYDGVYPGCGRYDEVASFRRPRDDGLGLDVGPCAGEGIVVRRDMGSLGVSSFQQVCALPVGSGRTSAKSRAGDRARLPC